MGNAEPQSRDSAAPRPDVEPPWPLQPQPLHMRGMEAELMARPPRAVEPEQMTPPQRLVEPEPMRPLSRSRHRGCVKIATLRGNLNCKSSCPIDFYCAFPNDSCEIPKLKIGAATCTILQKPR